MSVLDPLETFTTWAAGIALVVVLAVVGWFLWSWDARGDKIQALETQHDLDVAALAPLRKANADYANAAQQRKDQRDRELEEQQRIARQAQAQATQARAEAREAQARADTWRQRWNARGSDCDQALAALATACPALKDY